MSRKTIFTTISTALFIFAFVFASSSLVAHAQTYTNTTNQPTYTSYGTYLPNGTVYQMNGSTYTANGSTYIPTGSAYTVNGVMYVGGSANPVTGQPSGANTNSGIGGYMFIPAGTMYSVNGTAYANQTGTYVPNGSTYMVGSQTYIASGGVFSGATVPVYTTPTFPNTGLGGNALVNWSILALGLLGVAGVMYYTRRNAVLAR